MGNLARRFWGRAKRVWAWLCNIDSALSLLQRAVYLGALFFGIPTLISAWVAPQVSASLVGLLFFVLGQSALVLMYSWHRRKIWMAVVALVAVALAFFWGGWSIREPNLRVIADFGFEANGVFYTTVRGAALAKHKDKHRVAVVCRPYDASIAFLDDPNMQTSRLFPISTDGPIKIQLIPTKEMWERMKQFELLECGVALGPLEGAREGESFEVKILETFKIRSAAYRLEHLYRKPGG